MTEATSHGHLEYPPPAVFVTNVHPMTQINMSNEPPMSRVELQHASNDVGLSSMQVEQYGTRLANSEIPTSSQTGAEYNAHTTLPNQMRIGINNLTMGGREAYETEPAEVSQHENADHVDSLDVMLHEPSRHVIKRVELSELGQFPQIVPSPDSNGWELPFLQGWLVGQSQVGVPSMLPHIGGSHESRPQQIGSFTMPSNMPTTNVELAVPLSGIPSGISIPAVLQSGLQNQFSPSRLPVTDPGNLVPINLAYDGFDSQTIINRIQSELAKSVATAAATELPCTVNLKVWSYDLKNPCAPLQRCRLTIPHVVLCRYLLKL